MSTAAETAHVTPSNAFDVAESLTLYLSRQQRLSDIERALKWDDDPERRRSFTQEYNRVYEELRT